MTFSKKIATETFKLLQKHPDKAPSILTEVKDRLISLGLADAIPKVFKYLLKQALVTEEMTTVKILSSHKLTNSLAKKIADYIGAGKTTKTVVDIDENLIGGFTASFNNVFFDNSFKSKLSKMRTTLIN